MDLVMGEHLFSFVLIGLMGAASVNYIFHGNPPMYLYWAAGAILNLAVIWNGNIN